MTCAITGHAPITSGGLFPDRNIPPLGQDHDPVSGHSWTEAAFTPVGAVLLLIAFFALVLLLRSFPSP